MFECAKRELFLLHFFKKNSFALTRSTGVNVPRSAFPEPPPKYVKDAYEQRLQLKIEQLLKEYNEQE